MKLKELLEDIPVLSVSADLEQEITDITNDSRQVKPGCVFVAIKGLTMDGHRFIPQAVAQGASVIFCQEPPEVPVDYVQVADSRKALAMGARNFLGTHPLK